MVRSLGNFLFALVKTSKGCPVLSPLTHSAPDLYQLLRKSFLLIPCCLYCEEMDLVLKASFALFFFFSFSF